MRTEVERRGMALAFAIAALLLPVTLHAQLPQIAPVGHDDPAIAAKREQLNAAPFDRRAIVGEELVRLVARRFGPDSSEYAQELEAHATDLDFAGRSVEAQRAMEQVVAIYSKLHGAGSMPAARAKRAYAIALIGNGFKDRAVAPYRDYILAATDDAFGCGRVEQVAGGSIVHGCANDEKDLGDAIGSYGRLLHDLGRSDEAVQLFRTTIARFEPRWGGCESAQWGTKCDRSAFDRRDFLGDYAAFLHSIGRTADAVPIRRDNALPRLETLATCNKDDCRADYWLLGDFATWKAAVDHLDPAAARALGYRWFPVLAAEPIYARGAAADADYFDGQYRTLLDGLLAGLAEDAVKAGDRDRVLAILGPLGKDDLVGGVEAEVDFDAELAALGARYEAISGYDFDKRIPLFREKADIYRRQYGPASREYGGVLRELATELSHQDDDAATEENFRRALAIVRAVAKDDDFNSWITLSYLSDWLVRKGRKADAIVLLRDLLAAPGNDKMAFYADPAKVRALGGGLGLINDPHGPLNDLKADFAELLLETGGDPEEALAAARHAATGKRAWRSAFGFSRQDEMLYESAIDEGSLMNSSRRLASYSTLFANALWVAGRRDAASAETAFVALQEVQMGTTSRAVAKAAGERAIAQAGVEPLLAERRALDRRFDELEADFTRFAMSLPDQAALQRFYQQKLDEERRIAFRRGEIDQAIAAAVPGYFELIRPQALSLADAQALLAPDEAFLLLLPTEFGTHIMLVTRTSLDWHRSDLGENQLGGHVRRLLWDAGASIAVTENEKTQWEAEGEGDFPFDRGTAWILYQNLVAPFEAQLRGKRHLFTAATGSLSSLPLGILVTAPPTGADGDPAVLRATPWLADRHALLQLPSLQSLQLLRAVAARNPGRAGTDMIGFGDPVLDGAPAPRGIGGRNRGTRSSGLSVTAGLQLTSGDGPPLADPAALRQLARLPGTETELKAMQALLGPAQSRLFLAERATETNLKRSKLAGLSVLFLATHGLVAGEVSGVAEPGLVFTPPRTASAADDGLLTASEIATLDMDARWVILSACNTAAGDGSAGAPGLSGLARAFFFAGAESLLASHWPVRDDVAAVLTVRLFELMKANPALSRAEALQAATREIRDNAVADPYLKSWAHPSAWAPFSLIGDGIR